MPQLLFPNIAGATLQGFQQGQQMRANRLVGAAMQNPDDSQGYLAQAGAIDPRLALGAQGAMQAQRIAQQKMQQSQQQMQMKKIGSAARYMAAAIQTNNPQQIEGAYQAVRPYLAELGQAQGKVPPPQWDPSMQSAIYHVIAQTSALFPDDNKLQTITPGSVLTRGGSPIYSNPAQPKITPQGYQAVLGPDGTYHAEPIPIQGAGNGMGVGAAVPDAGASAAPQAPGLSASVPGTNGQNVTFDFAPGTPPEVIAAAKASAAANGDIAPRQQIGARPQTMAAQNVAGLLSPGNMDLSARPIVHNPDGSISTVRSITITDNQGRATLIPTVVGNRVVSNQEAIQHYRQTGQNLGTFDNEADADAYAQQLHQQQAHEYLPQAQAQQPQTLAQAVNAGKAGASPPAGYQWNAGHTALQAIPGGPADKTQAVAALGDPTLQGDAYLSSIQDAGLQQLVKAIAEGREQVPRIYRSGKAGEIGPTQIAAAVAQYDPTFNQQDFNSRNRTRISFTSGTDSKNMMNLNQAAAHAQQLAEQIPNLAGHFLPFGLSDPLNKALNNSTQAGTAAIKAWNTTADALAHEVRAVFAGSSGGTLEELNRNLQTLNGNDPITSKQAALQSIGRLLQSRIALLQDKYEKGMGKAADPFATTYPDAARVLDALANGDPSKIGYGELSSLGHVGNGGAAPAAGAMPTAVNPQTGERVQWNGSAWVPDNGQ